MSKWLFWIFLCLISLSKFPYFLVSMSLFHQFVTDSSVSYYCLLLLFAQTTRKRLSVYFFDTKCKIMDQGPWSSQWTLISAKQKWEVTKIFTCSIACEKGAKIKQNQHINGGTVQLGFCKNQFLRLYIFFNWCDDFYHWNALSIQSWSEDKLHYFHFTE